jgi:hypothetical protein
LAQTATTQLIGLITDRLRNSGDDSIELLGALAMIEMCLSIVCTAAWFVALTQAVHTSKTSSPREDSADAKSSGDVSDFWADFNQVLIEQIRALASIIWRVPLLLVPAATQFVRLAFVPMVVRFDRDYRLGRRDALKTSAALTRGHFWFLSWALTFTSLGPWLVEFFAQGSGGQWIWENPLGVTLGAAGSFFCSAYCTLFLVATYHPISQLAPYDGGGPRDNDQILVQPQT